MKNLTKVVQIVVLLLIGVVDAFVFSELWEWFVTPTFHIQKPTLAISYGLILFIEFLSRKKTIKDNFSDTIAKHLGHCLAYLTLGWIVYSVF